MSNFLRVSNKTHRKCSVFLLDSLRIDLFFDFLSATNSKAAIIPYGRTSPTMERFSRGIEEGSKISARKNPRACEGFLTEPIDCPVKNYFLRRHLATAPPIPKSPKTASEAGSGTTPEESSDWKVKKISRLVDPVGFGPAFTKLPGWSPLVCV